jgi:hypothetical protein
VEAPGGLRPEATPSFTGPGVGPRSEARGTGGGSDVAARERFEGEHPFVCWSPGRDGKTRDEGYVPSECQPKRWPTKALSGVWRPRLSGGRNNRFELAGAYVRTARHSTNAGVTLTASPAGSGARRRGTLASAIIRPLQEAARAAGRRFLLTTHFSGADEAGASDGASQLVLIRLAPLDTTGCRS